MPKTYSGRARSSRIAETSLADAALDVRDRLSGVGHAADLLRSGVPFFGSDFVAMVSFFHRADP
jgi:hypothetical protein